MDSSHIALGLEWIIKNCADAHCKLSGYAAAWANGDLRVQARLICARGTQCDSGDEASLDKTF
jgi:hypothetical protein